MGPREEGTKEDGEGGAGLIVVVSYTLLHTFHYPSQVKVASGNKMIFLWISAKFATQKQDRLFCPNHRHKVIFTIKSTQSVLCTFVRLSV